MPNAHSTRKNVRQRAKRAQINAQHIFDELEGINLLYKDNESEMRTFILAICEYSILLRDLCKRLYESL